MQNGQLDKLLRKAMGQPQATALPMLLDRHGNPISVIASVISIDRKVLAAIEEVVRRVVREEIVRETAGVADGEVSA